MKSYQIKKERLRSFLYHIYGKEEGQKRIYALLKSNTLKVYIFRYGKKEGTEKYEKKRAAEKIRGTLKAYVLKYGEKEGAERYLAKNKKLSVGRETLLAKGYSEEEVNKIKQTHSKKSAQTLENFIKRHGEEEGKVKWEYYSSTCRVSCRSKKDWIKRGYSEEEAVKQVKRVQERTLESYILKYGKLEGEKKWKETNKKRAFANTLDYYIEKYGEREGKVYYKQVLKQRCYSLSLEYYVEKHGEIKGKEVYLANKAKSLETGGVSKVQGKFAKEIYKELSECQREKFFGYPITKNKIIKFLKKDLNYCVPDIVIGNIIIEFDGDFWHSLPDVIERDVKKGLYLKEMGYQVFRVKEGHYRENPEETVKKIINKINEN